MSIEFLSRAEAFYDDVSAMLCGDDPFFLARFGGSDTDAVIDYVKEGGEKISPDNIPASVLAHLSIVQRYNGYYDKSKKMENYLTYCQKMLDYYLQCKDLVLVGPKLLSAYFSEILDPVYLRELPGKDTVDHIFGMIESRHGQVTFYPYHSMERIIIGNHTLFRIFEKYLTGMKVLVISPFSRSIESNFHNRKDFFKSYSYPEFEVKTLDTPITYSGLPDEYYPHDSWFSTTEYLKRRIAEYDFDIALLSCGSYAMPLGLHIRDALKKKAIYVGGVLQLYFGVIGRRYQNIYFTDQMNVEKFILPVESSNYMGHVHIQEDTAKEAFGAYF